MNRSIGKINESEKNRIRDEIDTQIAQYLQAGGKINVLNTRETRPKSAIGSVWRNGEELSGLGQ